MYFFTAYNLFADRSFGRAGVTHTCHTHIHVTHKPMSLTHTCHTHTHMNAECQIVSCTPLDEVVYDCSHPTRQLVEMPIRQAGVTQVCVGCQKVFCIRSDDVVCIFSHPTHLFAKRPISREEPAVLSQPHF